MKRLFPFIAAFAALMAATAALAGPNAAAPIKLVTVKSPVIRGTQAHLVADVGTAPRCGITVFKRHPYVRMRAKHVDRWGLGLYPKDPDTADGGRVAWTWIVGTHTRLGRWWVNVSCARVVAIRTSFMVVP